MEVIVKWDFFKDVGIETVSIEDIIILDGKGDDATAYLIFGNLDTEHLLVRESELRNDKYIPVVLLELLCEIEGESRCQLDNL